MNTFKKVIQGIFTLSLFLALVFWPAGTFKWPEAWIFIIFYLGFVTWVFLWLRKNNPGLLKERMDRKKDSKTWDRIIIFVYVFILCSLLVVSGLDAVRFRWSHIPFVLKIFGFVSLLPAFLLSFWAMRENSFTSDRVRIQEDRGHRVCTTGPYKYVRHPMYSGIILIMLGFPIALGSFYALVPASIIIALFVFRTSLEDKTLQQELEGYSEYTQVVRYRLVPRLW
jgi:protein-S-isoprenylcysteine O-methyltransferase Ste14